MDYLDVVNKIYCGNNIDIVKKMPPKSINTIVTSPPYFNFRSYDTEPVIFDGDPKCDHEWEEYTRKGVSGGKTPYVNRKGKDNLSIVDDEKQAFCKKCKAWLGSLGREKTIDLYIKHLCDLFEECKRILTDDGSLWINIGDGYNQDEAEENTAIDSIPLKSRMLIPWRFAIEMLNRGWILRNDCIWAKCLSGDTNLFIKKNDKYEITNIKNLYENFSNNYFVHTQDKMGKTILVKIKKIHENGENQLLKITTKSGKEIKCTKNHQFIVKEQNRNLGSFRKIKLKKIEDIRPTDFFYVNSDLQIDISKGNESEYIDGWIVGFYLAEGSWIYRDYKPFKNNIYSDAAIKKSKIYYGDSKNRGKHKRGVQFSCGKKDIERGYLKNFEKYHINLNEYGNNIHITNYDEIFKLVEKYVDGNECNTKKLKNDAFNTSINFLKGIMDGFLDGDGYYDKNTDRYRICIKPNELLKNQFDVICRILKYDMRYEGIRKTYLKATKKYYEHMTFVIRKKSIRSKKFGCILDQIENIENIGIDKTYDIEIDPIYTSKGTNQYIKLTSESICKLKSIYNNLYFLANGIWTHNSNVMPSSINTRMTPDYEPFFWFVKSNNSLYWVNKKTLKIIAKKPNTKEEGLDWGYTFCKLCKGTGSYESVTCKQCKGTGKKIDNYWIAYDYYYNQLRSTLKQPKAKSKNATNKAKGYKNPTYSGFEWDASNYDSKNMRTVWSIAYEPIKERHFAPFPTELVKRPLIGTCPERVCTKCGIPEIEIFTDTLENGIVKRKSIGYAHCNCGEPFKKGTVFDPFIGSGTTAIVALKNSRNYCGIELSNEYVEIIHKRLKKYKGIKRLDDFRK